MSKPKILVVSEIFWPEGGGAELATYLIINILRKANYKITIVTGTQRPELINGIKFYYTELLGNYNRLKRWLNIYLLTRQLWFVNLLKEHNIVYIPLFAYPLIPIAKKMNKKVIVHVHNYVPARYHGVKYYFEEDILSMYDEMKIGLFHEIYINKSKIKTLAFPLSYTAYKFSKIWLTQADVIICVSHSQAEVIKKQIPTLARKIKVVYNPLPIIPKIEKKFSDIPSLLYIGGDSYIKGFPIVLRIIMELNKLRQDLEMILVNKYSKTALEILSRLKNLYNLKIKVLGKLPHYKYIKLHEKAWGILFPSICEEPLPYAIIEAAFVGTIPIASKVGGVLEIIKGSPAERFLFDPGDIDDAICKIKKLLSLDRFELSNLSSKLMEHIYMKFNNVPALLIKIFESLE